MVFYRAGIIGMPGRNLLIDWFHFSESLFQIRTLSGNQRLAVAYSDRISPYRLRSSSVHRHILPAAAPILYQYRSSNSRLAGTPSRIATNPPGIPAVKNLGIEHSLLNAGIIAKRKQSLKVANIFRDVYYEIAG